MFVSRSSRGDRRKAETLCYRQSDHAGRLQRHRCRCRARPASFNRIRCERNAPPSSRIACASIGDILTVQVNITDKANIANRGPSAAHRSENSGVTSFFGINKIPGTNAAIPPGRMLTPDSTSSSDGRAQSTGGSIADQRRRRGDAALAERQSWSKANRNPGQLRSSRTDRGGHRATGRHPDDNHHRLNKIAQARRLRRTRPDSGCLRQPATAASVRHPAPF